jgi:type II secretory pathway pseudopilin PulG
MDEGSAQQKGAEAPLSNPREVREEQQQQQQQQQQRQQFPVSEEDEVEAPKSPFPPFIGRPVGEATRRYTDDASQPTAGQARATPDATVGARGRERGYLLGRRTQ